MMPEEVLDYTSQSTGNVMLKTSDLADPTKDRVLSLTTNTIDDDNEISLALCIQ